MRPIDRRQFLTESAFLAAAAAAAGNLDNARCPPRRRPPPRRKDRPASNCAWPSSASTAGAWPRRRLRRQAQLRHHHHLRRRSRRHRPGHEARREGAGQGRRSYEQDIRKVVEDKDDRRRQHRHAQPLARPGRHLGLQAGKDVYVEKPVSHNVSEGRRIVEAARKYNKICQTGTQSRSMQGHARRHRLPARRQARQGEAGPRPVLQAPAEHRQGGRRRSRPPKTVDYDLWCGPAPQDAAACARRLHYDWHWIWDYGNGDLGNQGIHEMDKARWGLNKNELPRTVISVGGRFGYVDDGETANTQSSVFDYGDCELIFEVRGWPSDPPFPGKESPKRGKKPANFVGNVWYGDEGLPRLPELHQRRRLQQRRRDHQEVQRRRATTSATSSRPSAAARRKTSTPTSSKGISPAPCATWATSAIASASCSRSTSRRSRSHVQGGRRRRRQHGRAPEAEQDRDRRPKVHVGRKLTIDPADGDVRRRQGSRRHADARVSQGLRGARQGVGIRVGFLYVSRDATAKALQ